MTTTNNKLEQKIKADFIAYFGNEPKEIKIEYVVISWCGLLKRKFNYGTRKNRFYRQRTLLRGTCV